MAARMDRVLEYVERITKEGSEKDKSAGVSAAAVAAELEIHRSDASADLNKLCKLGYVEKNGTRPVMYVSIRNGKNQAKESQASPLKNSENKNNDANHDIPFSNIIGSKGSIKAQIELAKAAVVYPPNGLHTLICGESGVGKSLMAEAMWRYAAQIWAQRGQENEKVPFVTFSCADYADNSQLLLSQLFGYVKGAFTGANEEHEGLVDRASGGILFLDEIHRLPPAGQELLFTLVDKGIYRRLGESREERKAQVMLICATSEDISSSLLMTFRRRIPVQITLPRISERPVKERIALIVLFVKQEAIRLDLPIWISGEALRTFTYYNCPANIGELRNDLQLCCARSYLSYLASAVDKLTIDTNVIPQRIFSMVRHQEVIDASINKLFKDGLAVEPGGQPLTQNLSNNYDLPIDLYSFIDKKIASHRQMRMSDEDVEHQVGKDLEKYFESVVQAFFKPEHSDMPISIIQQNFWEAANLLLNDAAGKMNRKYGRKTLVALALHLQQFKERVVSGRVVYNPNLKAIKAEHGQAYSIVQDNAAVLTRKLGIMMSPDEIGFIAMFLIHGSDDIATSRIGLIIVAHGRGTAQNMAEVANNLLGTDHVKSYDIPLNKSNAKTVEELQEVVLKANEGRGVIILVDMGFLVTMENMLAKATRVPLRIIPNVTTALVLEAGRRVLTTDDNLEQAVSNIYTSYDEYTLTLRQKRQSKVDSKDGKGIILVTCSSGEGVAKKIKEILLDNIPETHNMNFITVGAMSDIQGMAAEVGENLRIAIGSIDPRLEAIPFVHVSELFSQDGINRICALLKLDLIEENQISLDEYAKGEAYALVAGQLNKFVKTLSVDQVKACCEELVEKIEHYFFNRKISQDAIVRIYLHAACMFDRIHAGEALQPPDWSEQIKSERQTDFQQLKNIVDYAAISLRVEVPDSETCYFLSTLPVRNK
ncbi:sigma 54-interacting transcriptional regulator [Pelosinus fermentans]|uniref:sigma 54-interacting transcriptional regulator n=1 Tax=Pelosinus fermentans TaxID=365349 RepID=UPI0002685BCC|nr:sigma-54-dependent transcriptional regulator [Pelosinus fermentans]EIW21904.1 PTS system transcriptional activator [Pelosinus fermentans A11]